MKKLITLTLFLFFGIGIVYAQTYSPDRPGIGNGSFITPQNVFGVEAGIRFSTNDFFNQVDVGQVLLRYGIGKNLELRGLLNSYTNISFDASFGSIDGFNDMAIGAKYNFISGDDKPSVSALAELSLPVGSDEFSSDEVVPAFAVLADHTLNDIWSISSNLRYSFGVGYLDDSWLFTLTPGFTIPNNESIAGYFGYAGMYYGDGFNQHWLEGGMTYTLENGPQLDVNLGYDTESETFFIGAGIAKGF